MANITVVGTANSIQVDLGIYGSSIEELKGAWRKDGISFVLKANYVQANIVGEKTWCVSFDGNDTDGPTFQIDSVDTVAPTNNLDLFLKLQALIA